MTAPNTSKSPFLTRDEAAAYLRVSRFTLANWATMGLGPGYTKAGRRTLYTQEDLDTFLAARKREAA